MPGSSRTSLEAVRQIVAEQSALRRVATLVARGVPPPEIFKAVATEMGRLLDVDYTAITRFEPDGTMTVVANWSSFPESGAGSAPAVGSRWPIEGSVSGLALESGRPSRMRTDAPGAGEAVVWARGRGATCVLGCPITVGGQVWGAMVIISVASEQPPEDTEERSFEFIELVSTAIANAESRAELVASRTRLITVGDAARRRVERNLHDGAQQHLVSLALELHAATEALPPDQKVIKERLTRTAQGLAGVVEELRDISRGLNPAALAKHGLKTALKDLARRSAVPVSLDVSGERRLADSVEVAIYYVVSEALTNAAKHASASEVAIVLEIGDELARLTVRDDGVGGAIPEERSGLTGLKDRVEALHGTIQIVSPRGHGTSLLATLPAANTASPLW